ncbi:MAG TPA: glycosyltransferase family 39 protein [Saprospiraceae bacterium]|nr:glycosyltransferase family 39 protein [Saprospiraceae bacterium]
MPSLLPPTISSFLLKHKYAFLFTLILIGYGINLFIDIMEVDAAQYAAIAREMTVDGNYLEVYHRGQDYLDKPPLIFWISSIGISLFGNTSFAYKLLPVFFLMIGLWATYKFARLWYDHRTGILAALMLGTTQAFNLMSNDIRTDGLLTAFVMLSVWLLSSYLKTRRLTDLFFGAVCIGGAMLAKGPLGLFIPAVAIGTHLLLRAEWKKIFDPSWLLLIPVIALVLAPMCYGLYTQFDLHPEKEVYGLKGPSGIEFYFWTQSFGRITGESNWSNNTPWYFFLMTMLWDLQPWVILFIPAFLNRIKNVFTIRSSGKNTAEWISLGGLVIPFIALSFSGYKLPHYIFPVFPFACVIIASWLMKYATSLPRWLEVLQLGIIHILLFASGLVLFGVFPGVNYWWPFIGIILYALMWWWRVNASDAIDKWILPSLTGVLIFQLTLGLVFYPQLLSYQSTSQAGRYIQQQKLERVYWYRKYGFALDYYSGRVIPEATDSSLDTLSSGSIIFVAPDALPDIPPHTIIKEFDDFKVTKLNATFLKPSRRGEKVKKMYMVRVE